MKKNGECYLTMENKYSALRDNRGLSLVELMVTLTITVIVMGAAALFIHTGIRNYQYAAGQINLQKESQVAMEQLVTWVMEGNVVEDRSNQILVVSDYPRPISENSDNLPIGYKPAEYIINEGAKTCTPIVSQRVIWMSDNKLYMVRNTQLDATGSKDADDIIANLGSYETVKYCVAENIENFTVTANDKNTEVLIKMEMKEGTQTFSVQNSASVRNDKLEK